MSTPRFSIVITCHNQELFIRNAVESALQQNPGLREIIVVDDGSTDGSVEILEQYSDAIQLCRFPTNRGAIEARNYGAGLATGHYLVFLDGDDALMPWALQAYERIIQERDPKILLAQVVWFSGEIVPEPEENGLDSIDFVEYDALMRKDRTAGLFASAFVVNRRTFEAVGAWTPGIFHLDVQDVFTKLGYSGPAVIICSPATVFYRIHENNSVHKVLPFLKMQHRLMAKERRGEYPGGRKSLFERRAWLGGQVVFCMKGALRAGFYMEAAKLLTSGWSMIVAAVLRRLIIRAKGRRAVQTLNFHFGSEPTTPVEPVSASLQEHP
jgi:glycosyltransferase involved in cell wall biosynthesis